MKKYILIFISVSFLIISCENKKQHVVNKNFVKDDLHKSIEIKKIPERIITLAPNLTELAFELGVGNKIVGNSTYCNYPDSAKLIENVADLLTVNLEKISAINPDLIFVTTEGNSKSDYENLINLGFKVFVSNPRNFEGIKKTLIDMGKIFNLETKAKNITQNWDFRISEIQKTHEQIVVNSAMFLVSTNPIFSVGKSTFVHEILTFAGLSNVAADSKVNYPTFNREEILIRNPDYIILYETNNNDINQLLSAYPEWHTISAVVNKRVFFINADLYSRPGPRFVDAVEDLNKLIMEN